MAPLAYRPVRLTTVTGSPPADVAAPRSLTWRVPHPDAPAANATAPSAAPDADPRNDLLLIALLFTEIVPSTEQARPVRAWRLSEAAGGCRQEGLKVRFRLGYGRLEPERRAVPVGAAG
jgi:hypothetical protein